jgi:hypothetical protein
VEINLMKSKLALLALLSLVLPACEGAAGPTGPEGPGGPGTRIVFAGTLDAEGFAGHTLPAEAGDANDPPSVTCLISDDGIVWAQIGCLLGVDFDGSLVLVLAGAPEDAGLRYRMVVVY